MKLVILFKLLVFNLLIFFVCYTGNSQPTENEYIFLEVIFFGYQTHASPTDGSYFYLTTFAYMEILTEGYEYVIFCWVWLDENHDRDKYKSNNIFKIKMLKYFFEESITDNGVLVINNNNILFIE
jgi:hypothetical protein